MKRKFTNPFLQEVHSKVNHQRENCVILTTGKVQKGKSLINLTFSKSLDENFNIDRCVWLPQAFMRLMTKGKLKRGNAVMFEEIGTEAGGIPRRKWYDFNNFIINDVLQTFGFEGLIVFMSVPTLDYVDSNALKLVDYRIIAKQKYMKHGYNRCNIWRWEYNEDNKKFYKKSIIDYEKRKLKNFIIKPLPAKYHLVKDFYRKEFEYKEWIQEQGLNRIEEEFKSLAKVDEFQIQQDLINDLISKKYEYWKEWRNKYHLIKGVIETEWGIGGRVYDRIRDNVYRTIRKDPEIQRVKNQSSSITSSKASSGRSSPSSV